MKSLQEWLAIYGESHQNDTNKLIHYICVPAIYFTVLVLLASIPTPIANSPVWINWASIILLPAIGFYMMLSVKLGIVMGIVSGLMLTFILWWPTQFSSSLLTIAISIFVVGWVMQIIGHKIEGKKPSFFTDIQFLLIGPAWIMAELFGIED